MKILCLHGFGTSAAILETQMSTLFANADPTWDPVYVDGEIECGKARNLGAFVKGPFHCYYNRFAPADVAQAHDLIADMIDEEGPFDGAMGFSQGASILIAHLLQHQKHHPNEKPPFEWAALFSTVVAFSPDEQFGHDILHALTPDERAALATFPAADCVSRLGPDAQCLLGPLVDSLQAGMDGGFLHHMPDSRAFVQGDLQLIPRILHPDLVAERIPIPTVHIVGRHDQPRMLRQSALMRELCEPSMMRFMEHSSGHDVPRSVPEAKEAVHLINWAVTQGHHQVWKL